MKVSDIFLIVLVFLALVFYILKIDYHFKYYKILHPEKFLNDNSKYGAFFRLSNPITYNFSELWLFLPFFKGRMLKKERSNYKLKKLGVNIKTICYALYVTLLCVFFTIVIKFN